ncbi:MAG: hypothetical protein FWD69_01615 [Polyangiaceae bacterium]|nr:hypothetical protein [Polyangiaceae bacterium]
MDICSLASSGDCGVSGAIDVDRKKLPVVRNWLETYQVVMRAGDTGLRVASNSSAKRVLCEPDGSCDDPNGAFFWAKSPFGFIAYGQAGPGFECHANVLVRRTDGKFALVADLEMARIASREYTLPTDSGCVDGATVISFEQGGLIHVRAQHTLFHDQMIGRLSRSSQVDIFVDPTTGERVFSYLQQGSEDGGDDDNKPLSIQSVSVVNNQAILTGPKCHVAIRLP